MAAILDIGTEHFCNGNAESPCHPDVSNQVSTQSDLQFGRRCGLKICKMAAVAEWNNIRNSESICSLMPPIKYQRIQLTFGRRCRLKIFKMSAMMAILDVRTERL